MYFVGRGRGGAGAHSLFGLSGSALIRSGINTENCQEGFLECKRIGAMPAKEYSCAINLGFVLKCVTTGLLLLERVLQPQLLSSHICTG